MNSHDIAKKLETGKAELTQAREVADTALKTLREGICRHLRRWVAERVQLRVEQYPHVVNSMTDQHLLAFKADVATFTASLHSAVASATSDPAEQPHLVVEPTPNENPGWEYVDNVLRAASSGLGQILFDYGFLGQDPTGAWSRTQNASGFLYTQVMGFPDSKDTQAYEAWSTYKTMCVKIRLAIKRLKQHDRDLQVTLASERFKSL